MDWKLRTATGLFLCIDGVEDGRQLLYGWYRIQLIIVERFIMQVIHPGFYRNMDCVGAGPNRRQNVGFCRVAHHHAFLGIAISDGLDEVFGTFFGKNVYIVKSRKHFRRHGLHLLFLNLLVAHGKDEHFRRVSLYFSYGFGSAIADDEGGLINLVGYIPYSLFNVLIINVVQPVHEETIGIDPGVGEADLLESEVGGILHLQLDEMVHYHLGMGVIDAEEIIEFLEDFDGSLIEFILSIDERVIEVEINAFHR